MIAAALLAGLVGSPHVAADDGIAGEGEGEASLAADALALRDALQQLSAGALAEEESVEQLIGVVADDLTAVRQRRAEVRAEVDALRAAVAAAERESPVARARPLPDDGEGGDRDGDEAGEGARAPAAPTRGARPQDALALEIATLRLRYLDELASALAAIPDASRAALRRLGKSRSRPRERARTLDATREELESAAERLRRLAERARAGGLVGFRSHRDDAARALEEGARALASRTRTLERTGDDLTELADELEVLGRTLHREYLLAVGLERPSERVDPLFLEHRREQRRLRRLEDRAAPDLRDQARAIATAASALASAPERFRTISEAEDAASEAIALAARSDALRTVAEQRDEAWRLEFENDAVLLLSASASPATLDRGYTLSTQIVDDLQAELSAASDRGRSWLDQRRGQGVELLERIGSGEIDPNARWGVALLLLGSWLLFSRHAGRLVNLALRRLGRLPAMHGRLGIAVRWAGLLHKVLPLLLLYPIVRGAIALTIANTPEGELFLAVFEPIYFYQLIKRLIEGSTRRIARGRPALIDLNATTATRLLRSYTQLGVVVATARLISRVTRVTIGVGYLSLLAETLALVWLALQAAKECVSWRGTLAREWRSLVEPETSAEARAEDEEENGSLEFRLATAMAVSPWGALLSPFAFVRVVATRMARAFLAWLRRSNFGRRVAAARLRRRTSNGSVEESTPTSLPETYLEAFPLYPLLGDEEGLVVPRDEPLREILDHFERWQSDRRQSSLVVLGEKGTGKTTLLGMASRRFKEVEVVRISIDDKLVTPEALVRHLSRAFDQPARSVDEFVAALAEGPERVVLLDEVHNVFLRVVGGYRAYDALIQLVNETCEKVFWVLTFNSLTWSFLNEAHGRVHYFRRLLRIPPWSEEQIHDLIRRRNQIAKVELEFDDALVASGGSDDDFELLEGADDYFRLLWEASSGNPRVATHLWLSSLQPLSEDKLRVQLFARAPSDWASGLTDELLFALAAFSQHENLNAEELAEVLNLEADFARFALRFLTEGTLLEAKHGNPERSTLAAARYPNVIRLLRSKHLLFKG